MVGIGVSPTPNISVACAKCPRTLTVLTGAIEVSEDVTITATCRRCGTVVTMADKAMIMITVTGNVGIGSAPNGRGRE